MGDQRELSSSVIADNEDEIEKDAEKAYRNMSVEARVFGNLVTGVDDEEFEHVWQDETCHSSQITTQKQASVKKEKTKCTVHRLTVEGTVLQIVMGFYPRLV